MWRKTLPQTTMSWQQLAEIFKLLGEGQTYKPHKQYQKHCHHDTRLIQLHTVLEKRFIWIEAFHSDHGDSCQETGWNPGPGQKIAVVWAGSSPGIHHFSFTNCVHSMVTLLFPSWSFSDLSDLFPQLHIKSTSDSGRPCSYYSGITSCFNTTNGLSWTWDP